MQTPVRYYITCHDDRPVVRTIPVAVRDRDPLNEPAIASSVESTVDGQNDGKKPRVKKLALAKARRLRERAERR